MLLRSSLLHAVLNRRNPLHGDDKNQMILALFRRWSSKSSKSSTEGLIVDSFQGACLNVGYMTAKKKNTRKDNLSVIPSSLPLSSLHAQSQSGNSLTEWWVMGQDRRYSRRGLRNALFIEFANSDVDKFSTSLTFMWLRRSPEQPFPPHNRFTSLHQALGSSFLICATRDS